MYVRVCINKQGLMLNKYFNLASQILEKGKPSSPFEHGWFSSHQITCEDYPPIWTWFLWHYFLQRFRSRLGLYSLLGQAITKPSLTPGMTAHTATMNHYLLEEFFNSYSQQWGQSLPKVNTLSPCINLLWFYFTYEVQDIGSLIRDETCLQHGKVRSHRHTSVIAVNPIL